MAERGVCIVHCQRSALLCSLWHHFARESPYALRLILGKLFLCCTGDCANGSLVGGNSFCSTQCQKSTGASPYVSFQPAPHCGVVVDDLLKEHFWVFWRPLIWQFERAVLGCCPHLGAKQSATIIYWNDLTQKKLHLWKDQSFLFQFLAAVWFSVH